MYGLKSRIGSTLSSVGKLLVWLWKATQILCLSAKGASFLAIGSERSRVMPTQPSALATWKLKSIASSDWPKGILWMWMLTPASLYILRSLGALGQLRLALFVSRRGRLLPRSPATAAGHSGIGPDGPVHHLDLAEPILDEGLERILGRIDLAAIAVGDAPDPHAVEDGVGLVQFGTQNAPRHHGARGEGCRPAEERSPVYRVFSHVSRVHACSF